MDPNSVVSVDPHADWVQAGENVPLRKEKLRILMFEDLQLFFFLTETRGLDLVRIRI